MKERVVGIMAAMPEEIDGVSALLRNKKITVTGMREYVSGTICGIKTVVVFSRWGKTAAASTATTLLHQFNVTDLLFTGVAGALNNTLTIGDIVVAETLVQHDMDASPLVPRFEVPLLGIRFFKTHPQLTSLAVDATQRIIEPSNLQSLFSPDELKTFSITTPKCITGQIASGDRFIAGSIEKQQLLEFLPDTTCVEMEGAAVAQVCYENNIPFTVIRTISDSANEQSPADFMSFVNVVAGKYATEIIYNIFNSLSGLNEYKNAGQPPGNKT